MFFTRKPRPKLSESVARITARLRGGVLSQRRAALSVALGCFIGCTPVYGLHLLLVFVVCVPLRLDVPSAFLATLISNPLTLPFILGAEAFLGAALLGQPAPDLSASLVWRELLVQLSVGAALLGLIAALLGGCVGWLLARGVQAVKPSVAPSVELSSSSACEHRT